MEEISKKELLAATGISYGQLYRWKREGLIPEEWFIKRSAFTGQETFFPKERVLARIHSIQALKDSHSLEEIRENLADDLSIYKARPALMTLVELDEAVIDSFSSLQGISELRIDALAAVAGIYWISQDVNVPKKECHALINDALLLVQGCSVCASLGAVVLIEIAGSYHFILTSPAAEIIVSPDIKILGVMQIADITERLKEKAGPQLV